MPIVVIGAAGVDFERGGYCHACGKCPLRGAIFTHPSVASAAPVGLELLTL